jgi:hypothetical protein
MARGCVINIEELIRFECFTLAVLFKLRRVDETSRDATWTRQQRSASARNAFAAVQPNTR